MTEENYIIRNESKSNPSYTECTHITWQPDNDGVKCGDACDKAFILLALASGITLNSIHCWMFMSENNKNKRSLLHS